MTFGYFAPVPTALPVGLPTYSKKRQKSGKPANKPSSAKPAA